jgi:UDP-N-acetylmuramoyl-tripeptide--D-alanyl-D-alanine ligase
MSEMPALWASEEAARVTNGRVEGSWQAYGVSIDSRTLVPGDLFVALKGPTFDGHTFVADALARGAAAAMVARRPDGLADNAALLLVGDTFGALQDLGRAARARSNARIVGVAGSVGKTGVKEALLLILGRQGSTHASAGSFNNHWGVPLSLARMTPSARFAVFEMGMNHAGEIAHLTRQVRPHVAVVTTVEAVHIENFSSVEAIADAKGEIFLGLEPGGTALLNHDNPHFEQLRRLAREAGTGRILSFGRSAEADVRLLTAEEDTDGTAVEADVLGRRLSYRVGIPGSHWVANSLCVLAAVHAVGADVAAAAAALADVRAPKGRGLRTRVPLPKGRFELIDDSYNASPASMAASFEVLGRSRPADGGRRIAVLGDMLELGVDAAALHAGLAPALVENRIDLVFTAGPLMAHLRAALPTEMRAAHCCDSAALAPEVAAAVRPGDVISVKGSAGSRMRTVVEALLALQSGTPANAASRNAARRE